ncbi:hypothetical protein ACWKWU_17800 [Chitinophaga lutea]
MTKQLIRLFAVFGAAALLFSACASQKGASAPTANSTHRAVKGRWTLSTVSYEGVPSTFKISTVFSNIPPKCLEGSQWNLPENGYGSYAISSTAEGCSAVTQNIMWSTRSEGGVIMFKFKELLQGVKAKDISDGYSVELSTVDNTSMVWRTPVNVDGKTAYITYTFARN